MLTWAFTSVMNFDTLTLAIRRSACAGAYVSTHAYMHTHMDRCMSLCTRKAFLDAQQRTHRKHSHLGLLKGFLEAARGARACTQARPRVRSNSYRRGAYAQPTEPTLMDEHKA
eukprot:153645-Pleurochrysis_carterae.AAC.3